MANSKIVTTLEKIRTLINESNLDYFEAVAVLRAAEWEVFAAAYTQDNAGTVNHELDNICSRLKEELTKAHRFSR